VYDGLSLALARRLGAALATADRRLAEAAGREGVEVP
jgi:predicted nucleic acid-binding protein